MIIRMASLLTNDLVSIHKKFYQIYVKSEFDKTFFEMINEQQNILNNKTQVMFRAISEEKKNPPDDLKPFEESRYKILNLLDSLFVDDSLKNEVKYIREIVSNRLDIFKDTSESKIIDLMEIVERNSHLDFMFGLIDRGLSIIKHGPKKRIIYPERFEIENYILDPCHIFLVLKKEFPEHDLVNKIQSEDFSSEQDRYQKIIDQITSELRKKIDESNSEIEFDSNTIEVSFSKPKMKLKYQKFILETKSSILLDLVESAFAPSIQTSESESKKRKLRESTCFRPENILKVFKEENWAFLIPDEMFENFENVIENKSSVTKITSQQLAYPKLTSFINRLDNEVTNDEIFNEIMKLKDQIFFPDRELRTPLHALFSKKKFEVFNKIHAYFKSNPGDLTVCHSEANKQFAYIYKYHHKFDVKKLRRLYVDFDYLFTDEEFYELDEETERSLSFFSGELRNILFYGNFISNLISE